MDILSNDLVKKYFHCQHSWKSECSDHMAFVVLRAMQAPISKGERYLKITMNGDILEKIAEYDLSIWANYLRLPSQFQEKKECCEYSEMKWAHKGPGSVINVCADCMIKLTKPQPPPSPEPMDKCGGCENDLRVQGHYVNCTRKTTAPEPTEKPWDIKHEWVDSCILSPSDQSRLEQIRERRDTYRERGINTSSWEATFFLDLIDRLMKEGNK